MHRTMGHPQEPSLGLGVYSLSEVASYTKLHPSRVRSWFKERPDRKGRRPIFRSDYVSLGRDRSVSFLDLIDVLVAGQFRSFGVPFSILRPAYTLLSRELGTTHPFCHRDLYTDGKRIFMATADTLGNDVLTEVITRQQFLSHVKNCLTWIDYGQTDKLARRWRIADGVLIDPQVGFGKPVVSKTGVTTYVLANAFEANGRDAGFVADLFQLDESDVHHAVEFEHRCGSLSAA